MLLSRRFRGHPTPASYDPVMAITTDPTQPSAGKLKAESPILDAEAAVRVPLRTAAVRDSAGITLSGERHAGRRRPAWHNGIFTQDRHTVSDNKTRLNTSPS